jgi:dGTPase
MDGKDVTAEERHQEAVRRSIYAAIRAGAVGLSEVLRKSEGADPVLVSNLLATITHSGPGSAIGSAGRHQVLSTLSRQLPAPDPSRSQWWFSTAGLTHLLNAIATRTGAFEVSPRIFCLGAPTLGPYLASNNLDLDILDIDEEVLQALRPLDANAKTLVYDAADELPKELHSSFQIAVLDPPWYHSAIYTFINRSLAALALDGEFFCTLPSRLTRPDVEAHRAELIRDLVGAGHQILGVERGTVQYQVPRFELAALEGLADFHGTPWRTGDLLHVRKTSPNMLSGASLSKTPWCSFSRRSSEFRIFSRGTAQAKRVILKDLPRYSANVSTRSHPDEDADIWSTEKVGVQIGEVEAVHAALKKWAMGENKDDTVESLVKHEKHPRDYAKQVVNDLDKTFSLWSKFAAEPPLRLDAKVEAARLAGLSVWATKPSKREHDESDDPFRGHYQRDRDRILWSSGLRRLSNKTQLFPVEHDDDLRQRLTHSIEVFQLASTIGISFGLDGVLIEAGALAHDVGHTPFGHAGEHALNELLNQVSLELGGFNHYEHGADVLRYLEGPYHVSPVKPFDGLNLTPEILECVLKHTYSHSGTDPFSSEQLLARSKHADLVHSGYCHLEGQAVRAADKISYLISDTEDGIRLAALSRSDLLSCRFFHRPPLDFSETSSTSLSQQFAEQRRWVLKILMEDILQASSKRLARLSSPSRSTIRSAGEYMIQHSDEMLSDMEEIWRKLQVARLHKDRRVVSANLHAARIVSELAITYSLMAELIEERFRQEYERLNDSAYMNWYKNKVGGKVTYQRELFTFLPMHAVIGKRYDLAKDIIISTEKLVMAKDYVAALSDSRAKLFHKQIVQGR